MAGNPYAVDYSGLGEAVQGFKKRKYDKNLKKEVDTLIQKRQGLDTELTTQAEELQSQMDFTPDMDHSADLQQLNSLQDKRLQFQQGRHGEFGGLSPQDLQGMSTDAVAKYKDYVAVERAGEVQRKKEDTASAFVRMEALGGNPNTLLPWFNKYEAHKFGLPDGAGEFKETTQTHPDTGEPYLAIDILDKQGKVIQSMSKDKFMQFATSSLDPETTTQMAQDMKKGVHKQVVRAQSLKKAIELYEGNIEKALDKLDVTKKERLGWVGVKAIKDVLGESYNAVTESGEVVGIQRTVKGGEAKSETVLPKQVATKGSGTKAKNLFDLANLVIKERGSRFDIRDKMLNSNFGKEFFDYDKELKAMVPQIPKIKKTLKKRIAQADDTTEEGRATVLEAEEILRVIKETDKNVINSTDGVTAITQLLNEALGDPLQMGEGRLAAPVGVERPEARGVSKSRGGTARNAEGQVVQGVEPHVVPPATSSLKATPQQTGLRPKSSELDDPSLLSPKEKAARIKELRNKAKKLL